MSAVSLDQRESLPELTCAIAADPAMRSALGSVRAEGLEPDAAGMALLEAVAAGELSADDAVERAVALYSA